jgi:hypothetical protein
MAMNRQRRTSNINNIVTYDTLSNVTIPANLTVKGLIAAGFVKTDANGLFSVDTTIYQAALPSQAGNAGKYLTTNGSVLSWGTVDLSAYVPTSRTLTINGTSYDLSADRAWTISSDNIYNANGTLTGNRTVTMAGNGISFSDAYAVSTTSSALKLINTATTVTTNQTYYSPSLQFASYGSDGTTSHLSELRIYGRSTSAYPTIKPQLVIASAIDGGSFADKFIFDSAGLFTATTVNTENLTMNSSGLSTPGPFNIGSFLTTITINGTTTGAFTISNGTNNIFLVKGNTGNVIIQTGGIFEDQGYKLDVTGTARVSGKLSVGTPSAAGTFLLDVNGGASVKMPSSASVGFQVLDADGFADWRFYNNGSRPYLNVPRWANGTPIIIGNGDSPGANNAIGIGNASGLSNFAIAIGNHNGSFVGANSIAIGSHINNSGERSTLIANSQYNIGNGYRIAHNDVFAIGNAFEYYTTANYQGILSAVDVYIGRPARSASGSGNAYQGTATSINGNGGYGVSNSTGGNLIINGGVGLGTGASGDIIFGTATPTTSGTTIQTLTNRVWIKGQTGNVGIGVSPNASYNLDVFGNVRFYSGNNTYDFLVQNTSTSPYPDTSITIASTLDSNYGSSKLNLNTGTKTHYIGTWGAYNVLGLRFNTSGQTTNTDVSTLFTQRYTDRPTQLLLNFNRNVQVVGTVTDEWIYIRATADTNTTKAFRIVGTDHVTDKFTIYGDGTTLLTSSITANSLIKSGGTSAQFLKADGSVDSSSYVTSNIYTFNGTLSGNRTVSLSTFDLFFTGDTGTINTKTLGTNVSTDYAGVNMYNSANELVGSFQIGGVNATAFHANNFIFGARKAGGHVYIIDNAANPVHGFFSAGNVGINTGVVINGSSQLQVDSTTRGFLAPRMSTTQKNAIASPATGLQVYDTTLNLPSYYNGTAWVDYGVNIYNSNGTLSSARTITTAGNSITFTGGGSFGTNIGIGGTPNAINSLQVSTPNQWSGAFIGNMAGARTPSVAYGIHLGWNYTGGSSEANILWGTGGGGPNPYLTFSSWDGTTKVDRLDIQDTGKIVFKQYLTTTSFTGTPVGYIAFDNTGGLITVPVPTSINLYNSNGVLTGDRTVGTATGFKLTFNPNVEVITTTYNPTAGMAGWSSLSGYVQTTIPVSTSFSATGYGFSSLIANNYMTYLGSATFAADTLTGGILGINNFAFTAAASTVTISQGGTIRTYSGGLYQNTISGSVNGTITHLSGLAVRPIYRTTGSSTMTITNNYGLLINNQNEYSVATITKRWGIYQEGSEDNNYFAGKVIIGTSTSVGFSPLNINGLPTSAAGLSTGDVWNNLGMLAIV